MFELWFGIVHDCCQFCKKGKWLKKVIVAFLEVLVLFVYKSFHIFTPNKF